MSDLRPPGLRDVFAAQKVIRQFLEPTLLTDYPALNDLAGMRVLIKHENHQPVGAFKVRGGLYLMSQLSREERAHGVIAASTGNHGQSIAYAARRFDVPTIIGVPVGANQGKVEAMRALGAEVIFHGRDYDECRVHVEALARERGYRYVHSGDEPLLIAGVGTIALEILQQEPSVDTLIVPVGGGSGAAGACIAAKAIDSAIRVIGVQAEMASAVFQTWKQRRPVETESADTFAEGLATRSSFALPMQILLNLLDDFVLVSEEEMRSAIRILLEKTHNLAEGAGAASLAALLKMGRRLEGRNVAITLSGGNLSIQQLRSILA